jgi:hypothetical protein
MSENEWRANRLITILPFNSTIKWGNQMFFLFDKPCVEKTHLQTASERVQGVVTSESFKNDAKTDPKWFRRLRKLPVLIVLGLVLNQIKSSTQIALDDFFLIFGLEHIATPAHQTFSDARTKLKWEALRFLFDDNVSLIYEHGFETWNGYRIFAVDGSKIQLPAGANLDVIFGTAGRGDSSPTAQASMLFDVINGHIMDARIGPMSVGERKLAMEHAEHLKNHPSFSKELIIYDRGYASFELIEDLEYKSISYLMRLRSKFNVDIDKMGLGIHSYTLTKEGHNPINVQIIKFELSSGEIETLITNLVDPSLNEETFKNLYSLRWGIETQFSVLKAKLEIENFSSKTETGIYQDFFSSTFLYNMVSIAENEVQPIIDKDRENKGNKYDYKINKNQAIGVFKNKLIIALLHDNAERRANAVTKIIDSLVKKVIPIRPERSIHRNEHPRKAKFHHNKKSNC